METKCKEAIRHASVFSGIGGPEVAAAMLGWENVFHCEINPFGRAVLEYWFPESKSYEDITTTDFRCWRGRIDVLTGGFPCQPFSYAGKRGGEKTTVTSGRRCSALLTKSGPLGSLVRTLLESPQWSKEGYALTWEAVPLCSERVTIFTNTRSDNPSPSNESAETLSTSDIPSSRCLFRLRLSALRIGGIESSSSLMMQTPTAVMTRERPEDMRARARARGYKNGTQYGSLESQVFYDPRFKGLLKTPSAMDPASEKMSSKGISGTSGTLAQEILSGYVEKRGFILPTPTARDEKNPSSPDGVRIKRKMEQGYTIELNDLAPMWLLPTPTCNDSKNASIPVSQGKRNDSITKRIITGEIPSSWAPDEDGSIFRLSPLFTEEMMGFPSMWTALPFLQYRLHQPTEKETRRSTPSPSGEQNPSKPTETR